MRPARNFWTHWSGPGFELADDHLERLTDRYAEPGAFTNSIGWYRAGSGMVAQSLAETDHDARAARRAEGGIGDRRARLREHDRGAFEPHVEDIDLAGRRLVGHRSEVERDRGGRRHRGPHQRGDEYAQDAVETLSLRLAAVYHRRPMPQKEIPVEALDGESLVWTDGACSGNPGPGGWAAIVVAPGGGTVELSGGEPHTTNNRMEYTAALEGLRSLPPSSRVCIVTDSKLMLDSMTKWIYGWIKKGWKTSGGDPVKNQDLVKALHAEIARHDAVRWHWVKGHEVGEKHAHKALNDRADQLAVAAARQAAA